MWMITTALTMTLLVGLAVDLGGQVYAKQRAQDLAAQAARTVPGDTPSSTPSRQHSCPPPRAGMTGTSLDPRIAAGQPGAACVRPPQPASGDLPSAAQDEVAADDEQGEGEYPRTE